ncbi:hypothetical protein D3C73_1228130 [compost metagenome]
MQCPPTPGPGENGIKPKGFVLAALITSHIFISNFSHNIAISLINAIFTLRNVFSKSLLISAILGEETVTSD